MARNSTLVPGLGIGSLYAGGLATGSVVRDTTVARTGTASWKCDTGGANSAASIQWNAPFVLAQQSFARVYLRASALPGQTIQVLRFGGAAYPSVRLKASGKLALFDPGGTQIGSDSAAAITPGLFYMVELGVVIGTGATDGAEARLNGTSIASATAQTWSDVLPTALNAGWITSGAGTNLFLWIADVAINDASGAAQNSWPGSGRVVALRPVSVSAQGAWTIGSGGSIPTALSAIPPAGVADASTATSQARSVSAVANETLSVVTATYDSVIPSGATLTLVQPWADHAEGAATGTKNLDLAVSANPAGSTSAVFAAGGDSGAAGTWPSNWRGTFGPAVIAPTPTRSTGATLTIRDATTNANAVDVDAMALLVEYTGGGANYDRSGEATVTFDPTETEATLHDRRAEATLTLSPTGSKSVAHDRSGEAVFTLDPTEQEATLHDRRGEATLDMVPTGSRIVDGAASPPPADAPVGGAGDFTRMERFVRAPALVDRSGEATFRLVPSGSVSVERAEPDAALVLLAAGVL